MEEKRRGAHVIGDAVRKRRLEQFALSHRVGHCEMHVWVWAVHRSIGPLTPYTVCVCAFSPDAYTVFSHRLHFAPPPPNFGADIWNMEWREGDGRTGTGDTHKEQ